MYIRDKKPVDESIQEELSRERADVLASAGNKIVQLLEKMAVLSRAVEDKVAEFTRPNDHVLQALSVNETGRRVLLGEINRGVAAYNKLREEALLSYYYLLVTREALGLRNHTWVERFYSVPGKLAFLHDRGDD